MLAYLYDASSPGLDDRSPLLFLFLILFLFLRVCPFPLIFLLLIFFPFWGLFLRVAALIFPSLSLTRRVAQPFYLIFLLARFCCGFSFLFSLFLRSSLLSSRTHAQILCLDSRLLMPSLFLFLFLPVRSTLSHNLYRAVSPPTFFLP